VFEIVISVVPVGRVAEATVDAEEVATLGSDPPSGTGLCRLKPKATSAAGRMVNWLVVRDWDQGRRYPNKPFPAKEGKDLKMALFNPNNGIWSWLLNLYQTN